MPRGNVEALQRAIKAYNDRDIEALLNDVDPEVEGHPVVLSSFAGEATVYRGHEGARRMFREIDEAFVDLRFEVPEFCDLGDRAIAIGHRWA